MATGSRLILLMTATIALLLGMGSCAKKVTKVSPAPDKPAPAAPAPAASSVPHDDSFRAQEMDERMRQVLVPIYFDFNKYRLNDDAIGSLEKIAAMLRDNPQITLLAEGHCDERGSSEYNMGLGENRARSVKNWLSGYGIAESRIEMTSFGKERPARSGCESEECHRLNRRVEWKVLAR